MAIEMQIASTILSSLRFSSMEFRFSKIREAHAKTFGWMLSDKFENWLRSDDPIFWVSGKPGSGKSTLMKFLYGDAATNQCLKTWAGAHKVVVASYFFWINGSAMQKSQEGLFQSLLYDILRQNPKLIQRTFPSQWDAAQNQTFHKQDGWVRKDLLEAFTRLLDCDGMSTRFCLFIDGLDEYDGDHEELISVIKGLVRTRNVKLCIASRPWNVFEAGFGANQLRKLYLEQFNRHDIELYVKDTLESRKDFQSMNRNEPDTKTLSEEVVSKSRGVFLWVFLVVRSLIRGLQNRDRLRDLQRRLRAFPSDLNEFFNHMLMMSLEDVYRVQAARNFQVALSSPRPLSLLNYWYIDTEEGDPDYSLDLGTEGLGLSKVLEIQDDMRVRINGRSKGLLEVTPSAYKQPPFDFMVDFLHRTVKDFLLTKDAQEILRRWSENPERMGSECSTTEFTTVPPPEDFNPYRSICKSSIAELKTAPVMRFPRRLCEPEHIEEIVAAIFVSAQRYEQSTGSSLFILLEDMGQKIPQRYKSGVWSMTAPSLEEYAVQWNLRIFVREKLETMQKSPSRRKLLLLAACRGRYENSSTVTVGPDPRMVELILTGGPAITIDEWEINNLSLWYKQISLTNNRHYMNAVYPTLLQLFQGGNVRLAADSQFWTTMSEVLARDEVGHLRQTLQNSTMASRMLDSVGRWIGLKG